MDESQADVRRLSSAVFGNEKTVEVLLAFRGRGAATAQELSLQLGVAHSLIRSVLVRLTAAGILNELPRAGGSRGALYYSPADGPLWRAVQQVAEAVSPTQEQMPGTTEAADGSPLQSARR